MAFPEGEVRRFGFEEVPQQFEPLLNRMVALTICENAGGVITKRMQIIAHCTACAIDEVDGTRVLRLGLGGAEFNLPEPDFDGATIGEWAQLFISAGAVCVVAFAVTEGDPR